MHMLSTGEKTLHHKLVLVKRLKSERQATSRKPQIFSENLPMWLALEREMQNLQRKSQIKHLPSVIRDYIRLTLQKSLWTKGSAQAEEALRLESVLSKEAQISLKFDHWTKDKAKHIQIQSVYLPAKTAAQRSFHNRAVQKSSHKICQATVSQVK